MNVSEVDEMGCCNLESEMLLSRDKVYSKFCLQFSKLFIVSDFDKHHCFGAQ